MRGHVGTVIRGQARKREGARWHGDTWARADDERIGGSVDQKMHPFQVAGGSLGWQVAGDAFSSLRSRPSGLRFGCSGSGAGPGMSTCNPPPGAATCHPKIILTANRQPQTAKTCPLPLSPFTLIPHVCPSPLCLRISVLVVISSGRSPWVRRCSRSRGLSPRP